MKSQSINRLILVVTLAVSIGSFVFLNTRTGLAGAVCERETPLVEQALHSGDAQPEEEETLRTPDIAVLVRILSLAEKLWPLAG